MRIVSLLPSATEIVGALGLQQHLAGRSHECDCPPGVESLPCCTAPKFNPSQPSQDIDRSVLRLVQDGLSVYKLDTALLSKLRPDFVVTQSQCELCAVSFPEVEQAVRELCEHPATVINLEPLDYDDIFKDIEHLGQSLGAAAEATALCSAMRTRISAVEERTKSSQKKSVFCVEWLAPPMNAGNWIPALVEKAGGINLGSRQGEHSHYTSWQEVGQLDPDLLVIMPCGFGIPRSLQEMKTLQNTPEWQALRPVQEGQVYITDGNQYFNRPGPRIADAVEIMAEILYPEQFPPQHHGTGWIKLGEKLAG